MNYIREQSQKLEKKIGKLATVYKDEKKVVFDAGAGCNSKNVYFTLDADQVGIFDGYTFEFVNISTFKGDYVIFEVDVNAHPGVKKERDPIANIIVNVKGQNIKIGDLNKTPTSTDYPKVVTTKINGDAISNIEGKNTWSNNYPYSESILYNFVDYNNEEDK